jgi:hypothetical protein
MVQLEPVPARPLDVGIGHGPGCRGGAVRRLGDLGERLTDLPLAAADAEVTHDQRIVATATGEDGTCRHGVLPTDAIS